MIVGFLLLAFVVALIMFACTAVSGRADDYADEQYRQYKIKKLKGE
ncbi:MAG: hypothetical protein J6A59_06015 [Lachnospiraceae bacterium]|nr:hypothetical protein [Lachnospiraceae bacterium]